LPFSEGDPADIKLDPGFKEFFGYCKSQGIPVIIVSRYGEGIFVLDRQLLIRRVAPRYGSGMEPLIRAILSNLVGDDANDIEIISNSVDVHKDGSWNIKFRHPSR
jgi:2-hydroxy-3-keto-5-methylthiopentenyl-1-phosphate phosphatase